MLGETLSTNIGSTGSKAAAETHAEESEIIADEDADQLCAALNDTLLTWITELNWPGAVPPKVWRPRPKNDQAEEEVGTLRARRRQEEIAALVALRRLGWAPTDEQAAVREIMEMEVAPASTPAPDDAKEGVRETPAFAAADGSEDHLVTQVEELAGPQLDAWQDAVRARLEEHRATGGDWNGAANAALAAFADMQVDPMGRILGDALALAHLEGRAQVIEETGINPWRKAKGSKKKP